MEKQVELKGMDYYKQWKEINALISRYDWAVEGGNQPANCELSREAAADFRTQLLKVAGNIGDKF